MKKILLGLFALVVTTCAFAQMPQFNAEDMAKMRADRIKETCNTTDAQYKKLYDYFLKDTQKMMEQFQQNQGGGPGGFDMEAMQKRMEEEQKFIKSVLNEEQYKKYDEEQQRMRQGGFGGFGGPGGSGGFGR